MKYHRINPRAFTIVELIAVMGCLSVILGIAIVLLYQMFDLQIKSEEVSRWTRSTNRFVDVFRNDVHRFGKPAITQDAAVFLSWTMEGASVEYRLFSGQFPGQEFVQRVESLHGVQRKENYRLPDYSLLHYTEGTDKYAGLAALSLWQYSPKETMPNFTYNVFERTPEYPGHCRIIIARYKR